MHRTLRGILPCVQGRAASDSNTDRSLRSGTSDPIALLAPEERLYSKWAASLKETFAGSIDHVTYPRLAWEVKLRHL